VAAGAPPREGVRHYLPNRPRALDDLREKFPESSDIGHRRHPVLISVITERNSTLVGNSLIHPLG
jgi:hypothetical protein